MLIYTKAGDREVSTNPNYEYTLQDGHVLQFRWDKEYPGKSIGYSTIVFRVPGDFWDIRGTRDWKSINGKVFDLKKYTRAAHDGKYAWEPGYIRPKSISTPTNEVKIRRCDWFIDYAWMLKQGWISQKLYDIIYDYNVKTPIIDLDRDFTSFIFHEDVRQRLVPFKKNMAWTSGTKTVGSAGADYTTWNAAIDDMGTLTGNAIIRGLTAEEISDNACNINNDLAGYQLTLDVTSGQKHSGGAYGSGHRVNFGTYDEFNVSEAGAGQIDNVTIQDLAIDSSGANNGGVVFTNGGDDGHLICQRCVIKGDSSSEHGITVWQQSNCIIRNNAVYGFTHAPTSYYGHGIILYDEFSGSNIEAYNNTCCKNSIGIGDPSSTPAGSITIKNNLCVDNSYAGPTAADYEDPNSGFDTTAKNVSADGTSPDGATYQNWAGTANMENYAANDFRLAATDATLDDGDDLSGIGAPEQFSDDIEDQSRTTWYIGASEYVAVGVEVSATLDSLVLTEYNPTVKVDISLTAGVDVLVITEYAADVNFNVSVTAGLDTLTITEYAATVKLDTSFTAGLDALAIAEYNPAVSLGIEISAGIDALVIAEYAATIKVDTSFTAGLDALVLTEHNVGVNKEVSFTVGIDTLVLTEYNADIITAVIFTAGIDNLILTEYAAVVDVGVAAVQRRGNSNFGFSFRDGWR